MSEAQNYHFTQSYTFQKVIELKNRQAGKYYRKDNTSDLLILLIALDLAGPLALFFFPVCLGKEKPLATSNNPRENL